MEEVHHPSDDTDRKRQRGEPERLAHTPLSAVARDGHDSERDQGHPDPARTLTGSAYTVPVPSRPTFPDLC